MSNNNEYSGILLEKIPTAAHKPLLNQSQYNVLFAELVEQKVAALFTHYGIEQNNPDEKQRLKDYETLLIQVAKAHISGFQFDAPPRRWMGNDGIMLFLDVIGKAQQRNWNFSWACQQLVKTEKYKGEEWRTLYTRFSEQRKHNHHIAEWFATDDIAAKRRIAGIIEHTAVELYKDQK